jgi:isopentenyl-diphosphate delta-isomerase type 1
VTEYKRFCYFVAGVVGEMLTDVFCDHSPLIEARRDDLEARAVSLGLGLQMTNILKDIWDDYEGGVCWLPREVFQDNGYDLEELQPHHNGNGPAFAASMRDLLGVAHAHLREALDYTLTIPTHESGIRRFLIWAALLAVSTLRRIDADPLFASGAQVKVSHRRVAAIVATSNVVLHRAFSLFIFNPAGELLLQQRSAEKRLWPRFWSNSCCSHPRRGETMEVATERRLAQELGMTSTVHHLFTFRYQAPYLDLGSENEVCWVFAGLSDSPPRPNIHEIADVRWITADDLDREFLTQPEVFTPWFAMEWPRVRVVFRQKLGLKTEG